MQRAADTLEQFGVDHEFRVLSAHKTPDDAFAFAASAADDGFKVIIAGAGKAAHLEATAAPSAPSP